MRVGRYVHRSGLFQPSGSRGMVVRSPAWGDLPARRASEPLLPAHHGQGDGTEGNRFAAADAADQGQGADRGRVSPGDCSAVAQGPGVPGRQRWSCAGGRRSRALHHAAAPACSGLRPIHGG